MSLRLRIPKMLAPQSRRSRAGLTFVEMSVVSLITATIVGVASQMYLAANDTMQTVAGQGLLQMELTQAADAFRRDASLATSLPASSNGYTSDLDSISDGTATLILRAPSIGSGGAPLAGKWDDFIYTFNVNDSNPLLRFRRLVFADISSARTNQQPRVVALDIARVQWTWVNVNLNWTGRLELTMQLWGSRPGKGRTLMVASRAVLRNTAP